jgi:hypothetical protein
VEDGNNLVKSVLLDKPDKGFIGICFNLKKEMDYLINTLPIYVSESKDLSSRIGDLEDIGEYNKYIRQKIDENILMEEETLSLIQNQPTFEQMMQQFMIQEENFEKAKIQLFDETTAIHEELKLIKEMKGKKLNMNHNLIK